MSIAAAVARSCAQGCAESSGEKFGAGYPPTLALLWSSAKPFRSLKGAPPVYTDTPVISAGGVVPGDGPSFTDVVTWSDGGTLVVEFTATTASADLVGDVQVFGPLYVASTGLKAMDGTNVASVATGWDVGDVVTGVVVTTADGFMRVARGEAM